VSWETIRDKMSELLEAVPDVGQVHKYRRHTTFWDGYFRTHTKDGLFHSWEITRVGLAETLLAIGGATSVEPCFRAVHSVEITGRMAVDDDRESELIFQDLIERIRADFRADTTFSGVLELPANLQVPEIGHDTFGGVLVHFVTLTLAASERVGG
jgi:hypothetical protein